MSSLLPALAQRFALSDGALLALGRLLALVVSDPVAPTGLRDPDAVVNQHFADALVAVELDAVRAAGRIADLGSGAGFPGLVLAAAVPHARVSLVESQARKCAFIDRAIADMGLTNAESVTARAESWTAGLGACDVVTARALASLPVVVEYAAPLLRAGGALVAWKGRRDDAEEADAAAAAAATGLEPAGVRPVRPWGGAQNLHLHLYLKVGLTPNRFPRREGMASKRPLRVSG